jgi:hypothetical protein
MRRSFTALMAVALLAALAPTAAFAAKPDLPGYHIRSISVVAGPADYPGCRVYVTIAFSQPEAESLADYMLAVQRKDGGVNSTPPTDIARAVLAPVGEAKGVAWGSQHRYEIGVRGIGYAYDGFKQVRLDTDSTWQWGAQLFSGSFWSTNSALSDLVLTGEYVGTPGSCPAPGTLLASY